MQLLFLDDAMQRNCSRPRLGSLAAIGGTSLEDKAAHALERELDRLCKNQYGFPAGEPFKWSPARDHWMRTNLVEGRREAFFTKVLTLALEHGASAQVAI